LCGNCVDDNHDGLVDWEDPQCCAQPMALAVDRVTLRPPPARVHGRGVDLRPVVGGSVRVTLRVGSACARTTMALRTSR